MREPCLSQLMEPIIPLDHKSKQRRPNGKQNAPASLDLRKRI